MQEPVPGISAVPDEGNARYFHVIVSGKFTFQCFLKILIINIIKVDKMMADVSSQDPPSHLSREEYSNWNCFYLRTIPCRHPK